MVVITSAFLTAAKEGANDVARRARQRLVLGRNDQRRSRMKIALRYFAQQGGIVLGILSGENDGACAVLARSKAS